MDTLVEDEFYDDELYAIMKKGRRTMPFDDFDEKVMNKIHIKYGYKTAVSNNLKLSLIFFIIGTLSGITLTLLFMVFGKPVWGLNPETLALPILFVIAAAAKLSVDNFIRLIKKYNP